MPYFVPDIYALDLGAAPNFSALTSRADMVGVILKATQGVQYAPQWFVDNWPRARAAAGGRYGSTFFRGCYHFGMPTSTGTAQADYCLNLVDAAGGLASGDLPVAWDLEGSAWSSSQQIVDISSQFAERVRARTGKVPVLYTGAAVRDRQITAKMGYAKLWTPHLDMSKAGWALKDYALWQYAGDGKLYNPASAIYNFPLSIPGWGATDMNVVMKNGAFATSMSDVTSALVGGLSLLLFAGAAALAYFALR